MRGSLYRWNEPEPVTISPEIDNMFGKLPLLAEAMARRGIFHLAQANAFINPALYSSSPSTDFPDMEKGVERLQDAILAGEKIGVWGDFDVDGQTATTILVDGLRRLGGRVDYHIPIREIESHGMNLDTLPAFLQSGVQVILTCDTGISAFPAVEYARQLNVDTIITDHHALPPQLPRAVAVINSQRLPSSHPLWPLCGVGCAFKLVEEIFRRAGRADEASQYLDLVALGTVADMALLTGDCRYLVQRGLVLMREQPRPSIKSILEIAEVNPTYLTEEHISFVLAPRLNSIGRLDDANLMVEFLTSSDPIFIQQTRDSLEALNGKRKLLCEHVFQGAQAQISRDPNLLDAPVLVLNHPQWPAGVIGIVASRLVEIFHRPAILISSPPGQVGRASARSIEGINITSAIAANQQYLRGFGGHPMAAGFSIDPEQIPGFRRSISTTIETMINEEIHEVSLQVDSYVNLADISVELVEGLERLAPFGPGNPSMILAARNLTIQSKSIIGRTREHLRLILEDPEGISKRVIWWQGAGRDLPEGLFDMAYSVRSSNFNGLPELQIEWIDARPVNNALLPLNSSIIQVLDYRNLENAEATLEQLAKEEDTIIWREGEQEKGKSGLDRYHLQPAGTLVVWSIPPGRQELQKAIEIVKPRRMILFSPNDLSDHPSEFLQQLAGLVRFAIRKKQGKVRVRDLAAALGQREITIHRGIDGLIARGLVHVSGTIDQTIEFAEGGELDQKAVNSLDKEIRYLLHETAAFRDYYIRAAPEAIVSKG